VVADQRLERLAWIRTNLAPMEDKDMSPDPFVHLANYLECYPAVEHTAPHEPVQLTVSSLHVRLLRLAARRLREGLIPPRSYYWWNNDEVPARLRTRPTS
jgi:hypothetical protein